jgi:hypothetical protein
LPFTLEYTIKSWKLVLLFFLTNNHDYFGISMESWKHLPNPFYWTGLRPVPNSIVSRVVNNYIPCLAFLTFSAAASSWTAWNHLWTCKLWRFVLIWGPWPSRPPPFCSYFLNSQLVLNSHILLYYIEAIKTVSFAYVLIVHNLQGKDI